MHRMTYLGIAAMLLAGLTTACGTDTTSSTTAGRSASSGTAASASSGSAQLPAPAANDSSSSDDADVGTPSMSSEDARLLLYANGLILQHVSRDEMIALYGENIPESEVEECMNDAGFEYVPEQAPEDLVEADARYSMEAEDYAATYGLGIAGQELQVLPPIEESRNVDATRSMSNSERDTYSMTLGHCRGGFDPERRAWSDAINIALEQFRAVLDTDDSVVAALDDWQTCMSTAGFDFEDPWQMRQTFYSRMHAESQSESLEDIFDDELRVAVANVPCEADYEDIRRRVISDRFDEFKTFFETALASGATLEAHG